MPKLNRPMPPRGSTRISAAHNDFTGSYKLTVPAALARMVGPDALFAVELVDEGILYRYVEGDVEVKMPRWLT